MEIKISDIIALIALILAIQTAFSGIYIFLVERRRKKIIRDVNRIKRNSFHLQHIAENIVECILDMRSAMEFQNGLIDRLLRNHKDYNKIGKSIKSAFKIDHHRIEKSIKTLMVFTDNKRLKQSALRQLGESFGDANTLESLNDLLKFEGEMEDDIRLAINLLKKRINTSINSNH